jgi:hypothetical protein
MLPDMFETRATLTVAKIASDDTLINDLGSIQKELVVT